ncbi:hypothetical protein BDZ94DRAFT_1267285 [Collybia nuda]|uniref:Uncharacterized protein n=1 Tax=Collybia nuda TaxID=64659 RepID=A0A9P6CGE0_9AGAR|nr:hypothetical protein BDZ94DRAFT_1267283 [Collybia nuda]KAF9459864.1 hypothetical protein BDZ94DRAFT_1267285 [Collybia nuda]
MNAEGSFIYASTVLKYIKDEDYHPVKRLAEILNTPSNTAPFAQIDHLYHRILAAHPDPTKLLPVPMSVCLGPSRWTNLCNMEIILQAEPVIP